MSVSVSSSPSAARDGAPGVVITAHSSTHDRGILDEHGVGEFIAGREVDDRGAERFERFFVGAMLLARELEVDRLARLVRQLTIVEGRADAAGDGD